MPLVSDRWSDDHFNRRAAHPVAVGFICKGLNKGKGMLCAYTCIVVPNVKADLAVEQLRRKGFEVEIRCVVKLG